MDSPQIRGTTRLVALLGDPVAHSISPQIHNHAFCRYNLPLVYVPLRVGTEDLHNAVYALRSCGFAGANVTIPHKRQIVNYCDTISTLSSQIGTVNTLYFQGNLLCGTTTDPEGFLKALSWMGRDCRGDHCVILGNGGVARTLGFALAIQKLPATLTLIGRNENRVRPLVEEITAKTGFKASHTLFSAPNLSEVLDACTLCVNCTNVGMHPRTDASPLPQTCFHEKMVVFDTIYNPVRTEFLKFAEEAGCKTQNGLRMLLYQALASLRLWTGVDVSEDIFDVQELQRQIADG